jgi:hypothetical protein
MVGNAAPLVAGGTEHQGLDGAARLRWYVAGIDALCKVCQEVLIVRLSKYNRTDNF